MIVQVCFLKLTDYDIVSLNLSSRCINERNFQLLVNALSESTLKIESLDLSFNQFFKDQSLSELIHYMECKSIDIIDCKCKHAADSPIIKALKYEINPLPHCYSLEKTGVKDETIIRLISVIPFVGIQSLNLSSLNLSQNSVQALINMINQ